MIQRLVDLTKGLFSLGVLIALMVGVPAALVIFIGFPLPTEMPSLELISNHLQDGDIPDEFVVKTLACFVWFVWLQMVVAVLSEMIAVARGRAAGSAPVFPGLQMGARKLVASSVLIISALSPARGAAAAPLMPVNMDDLTPVQVEEKTEVSAFSATASVAPVSAEGQYETKAGDNWWDMAERLLGDGLRWSELRDLNEGRTMLTGDSVDSSTETVKPGWRLDVPADADGGLLRVFADEERPTIGGMVDPARQAAAQEAAAQAAPGPLVRALKPDTLVYEGPTGSRYQGDLVPYQVVEGDNLWDLAERHLGDPFRWPEIFELSTDRDQGFDRSIQDPNLIWPDDILVLPSDAQDVPDADADRVEEVLGVRQVDVLPTLPDDQLPDSSVGDGLGAEAEAEVVVPVAAAAGDEANGGGDDFDPGPLDWLFTPAGAAFGAGGAFVASGLLAQLMRARRLRRTEAGADFIPAPPPMDLVDLETVLRNNANDRAVLSVHTAIESLTARPVVAGEPVPNLEVVRMSADRVEVVQDRLDPDLPPPWMEAEATDWLGGRSMAVLPAEFFPHSDNHEPIDPAAPLFVTVGGGLMLNLEAVGIVSVDGPIELSAGLIRSMVHELATGPARRSIDIRVSSHMPGADLHEHVRSAPLDTLIEELRPWMDEVELAMQSSGHGSAYALRSSGTARPPAKVIFADAAEALVVAPLVEQAKRRALPLAIVFSGDVEGAGITPFVSIDLSEDILELRPYGFKAIMQSLDVDLVLGTESLINHAQQTPMMPRTEAVSPLEEHLDYAAQQFDHPTDPANVPTEETPEQDLVTVLPDAANEVTDQQGTDGLSIRVLGQVEVEGGTEALNDLESSAVAFLAIAGPSTEVQIGEALWPGDDQWATRWSALRPELERKLGDLFWSDGKFRLRSVVTDLGMARRWLEQARGMSEDRARNLVQLALSEVRGGPFTGIETRNWQWTADHQMAIVTQANSLLIDACFDLCDSAYDADDLFLANWACEVAAKLNPLHETVTVRRVQLLQTMGESEAAATVVSEWEDAFEASMGRPAPYGPRLAMEGHSQEATYVG